jgi:hypothetical protein
MYRARKEVDIEEEDITGDHYKVTTSESVAAEKT